MTFDPVRFEALRAERTLGLGRPISFRSVTESTNDDALTGARDGAPHGALYVAALQTAGRGRRGNRWFGAAGECLTFTLLLRPVLPVERASGLALVAGLAVRAAAEMWLVSVGRNDRVLVKWPNDVEVGGRKLCGILAESQVRGAELAAVVLGIGLNVGNRALPPELRDRATSLAMLGLENLAFEPLLSDLLAELEPRLVDYVSDQTRTADELGRYDALFGRRLKVGDLEGLGAGINRSGSLLLRDEEGTLREVLAGHVELLDT